MDLYEALGTIVVASQEYGSYLDDLDKPEYQEKIEKIDIANDVVAQLLQLMLKGSVT